MNDFKAVCDELSLTRTILADTNKVLDRIVDWLEFEVEDLEKYSKAFSNKSYLSLSGSDFINVGKHETAEELLRLIRKWESKHD